MSECKTLRELEKMFIMQQFGYNDIEDFYADADFCSRLDAIKVPTLFLNASDDMFSPRRGMFNNNNLRV
jgi:predicted alpha/beta-fold hydrolase